MNHDAVFYAMIICVAGASAVVLWLGYMAIRNAIKGNDKK
jgi:hypothetical protein